MSKLDITLAFWIFVHTSLAIVGVVSGLEQVVAVCAAMAGVNAGLLVLSKTLLKGKL